MGREAFDSEGDQVTALSGEGLYLNAPVEVVFRIDFIVGVIDLEALRVEGMELYLWIVYGVLQRDGIIIGCAAKGVHETDLDHMRVDKEVRFHLIDFVKERLGPFFLLMEVRLASAEQNRNRKLRAPSA